MTSKNEIGNVFRVCSKLETDKITQPLYITFEGRPEDYIDQSRRITVNIGPSDIRTSMLKQRMFLSKTYVFMQEEQQGYKVFAEQAAHEMHRGAYDRALTYLNRAIRVF